MAERSNKETGSGVTLLKCCGCGKPLTDPKQYYGVFQGSRLIDGVCLNPCWSDGVMTDAHKKPSVEHNK